MGKKDNPDPCNERRTQENRSSQISRRISASEMMPQYDISAKRLLSEKIVLAWILKECVQEFADLPVEYIAAECIEGEAEILRIPVDRDEGSEKHIIGLNTEDASISEGKIYYDIRFNALVPCTKEPVYLIINIEAQKNVPGNYPLGKRSMYYVARLLSAEKNTVFLNDEYDGMRKVYSIWIQMNPPKEQENSIVVYEFGPRVMAGNFVLPRSEYDLMTVIMIGLSKSEPTEEKNILRLLEVLLSQSKTVEERKQILEKDFNIAMEKTLRKEAGYMTNLGEALYDEAFAAGSAFGEKKGEKKGVIKGARTTAAQNVMSLMQYLGVDSEKAMNILKVTDEEKPAVLKAMKKMKKNA